jgi:hypothetical protein
MSQWAVNRMGEERISPAFVRRLDRASNGSAGRQPQFAFTTDAASSVNKVTLLMLVSFIAKRSKRQADGERLQNGERATPL